MTDRALLCLMLIPTLILAAAVVVRDPETGHGLAFLAVLTACLCAGAAVFGPDIMHAAAQYPVAIAANRAGQIPMPIWGD